MEYELVPSPARAAYRTYDPLSPGMRMYGILLNESYTDQNIMIQDGETAVGISRLKLFGTSQMAILGTGRLAII